MIGFTVEEGNISDKYLLKTWDLVGKDKYRDTWREYYKNVNGILFVVDSSDKKRIDQDDDNTNSVKKELELMLKEEELKDAVILIYANKCDADDTMKTSEILNKLGTDCLKNHNWYIQMCVGQSMDGVYEGLDWIVRAIEKKLLQKK